MRSNEEIMIDAHSSYALKVANAKNASRYSVSSPTNECVTLS